MLVYEREYRPLGVVCGIDEVGRGPLAGPVVAGAVILPEDCQILYLNDSKKLTERRRELLYEEIMEKAVAVGLGVVSQERIDEINILQATYEAMREAVGKLDPQPEILLNDAVTIPGLSQRQSFVIAFTVFIGVACPSGATTIMFSERYGKNTAYATEIFVLTTLLSLITIPLLSIPAIHFLQ